MEKTFEELIEEKENVNVPNFIHFNNVLELLQQVREATITECANIAFWEHSSTVEIHKQIIRLETDRIILTDK